jgi:hypothetical protein
LLKNEILNVGFNIFKKVKTISTPCKNLVTKLLGDL